MRSDTGTRLEPLLACAAACASAFACASGPAGAEEVRVGRGSYNTTLPVTLRPPRGAGSAPARPRVTANVRGAAPTNDWWTSLIWQRRADNPFSDNLYAHPLALRAKADGLGLSYPTQPAIDPKGRSYHFHYAEDLTIGVEGLRAGEAQVDGFGDWTVEALWADDGGRRLRATFGHGLPYVYCQAAGGAATVSFRGRPTLWRRQGNVVGLTVQGHHYGLFAPAGATWEGEAALRSTLGGKGYFSVALLPDDAPATLDLLARHAFAFVTDTRVSWRYDPQRAALVTRYELTTQAKEGDEKRPLAALYRHQWLNTKDALLPYEYASSRGAMKLLAGAGFTTEMSFGGVLPCLPGVGAGDAKRLRRYVREDADADKPLGTRDTYWTGKELGRLAALAHAAHEAGVAEARDRFVARLKAELEDWLSAPDGKAAKLFTYDDKWGTLIGCPASYGSDDQLNDHHFHYGYFIMAAAAVARFDPAWAKADQWGGMVEMLIRDAANWDRGDARFPFLRDFDPYAGHGWASGHAAFAAGNNQESSSESLNFAAGVLLWGAATGQRTLRDLGVYLYETEVRAVQQYWFDVDRAVFPKGFGQSVVGMVWGNGGAYATWWTANPEEIHGINFLPITGASLYLGRRPDYVERNYRNLLENNGGPEQEWRDLIRAFHALADADAAAGKLDRDADAKPTSGGSRANTYHWVHALRALGRVDTTVTADVPTYAVFRKGDARTHVAWNPTDQPVAVTFSDGAKLHVPPGALAADAPGR